MFTWLDAEENYLRLTFLQVSFPQDSAVGAVWRGAEVLSPGVHRRDSGVDLDEEVVLITTKGEDTWESSFCPFCISIMTMIVKLTRIVCPIKQASISLSLTML